MQERKSEKLWVRSRSRRYPLEEIWILASTALQSVERGLLPGEKLPPIIVAFADTHRSFRGLAAWTEMEKLRKDPKILYCTWKTWQRVKVWVGKPEKFPIRDCHYYKWADMPTYDLLSYREAVVAITAHEIGHTLGYSGRKGGEEKCDTMSIDALDYYRKNQAEIDGKIQARDDRVAARQQQMAQRQAQERRPEVKAARKLDAAQAKLVAWQRKLKLATTKVKAYERTVRRLEKRLMPMPVVEQPLALAAKTSNEGEGA